VDRPRFENFDGVWWRRGFKPRRQFVRTVGDWQSDLEDQKCGLLGEDSKHEVEPRDFLGSSRRNLGGFDRIRE
jgi:hypothetical protein